MGKSGEWSGEKWGIVVFHCKNKHFGVGKSGEWSEKKWGVEWAFLQKTDDIGAISGDIGANSGDIGAN